MGLNPTSGWRIPRRIPRDKDGGEAREFRDDDTGFQAWLATHPDGYVINIARITTRPAARGHRADCRTINRQIPRGVAWTGSYV